MSQKYNFFDLVSVVFILISSLLILITTTNKIQAKKQQILCSGNLQHLYTALRLYTQENKFVATDWDKSLQSFLFSPEALKCPSANNTLSLYSYKLNKKMIPPGGLVEMSFILQKTNGVLLFDADNNDSQIANKKPYQNVANRHLGGANLLLLDGSVSHCSATKIGLANSEIGWQNEGNYLWYFNDK